MGLPIKNLVDTDCAIGLPTILVQYHGFWLKIEPDRQDINEFGIVFYLAGQPVCSISKLGDVELVEKVQPEKCYDLVQVRTGERLCEIFWPK